MQPKKQKKLLSCARASIKQGLQGSWQREPASLDKNGLGASFVTLTLQGSLRGCIGSLEVRQPLIIDVWQNAFNAAFRDSRFPPLDQEELDDVQIAISILTPALLLTVDNEQDLLNKIRPGVDGLILEEGNHRATFLPSVWNTLPKEQDFLLHLKRKAGFADDYWSSSIKFATYQTISFTE
ncbi:AmmeMemoRadiSam system protein A [Neptunomonas japonica]|uniref:AmmeMemoRadiSam system protein A n=1 Tax=Neptunomonas japonica TaxID=417574 RepID=UPI0004170260|nr:AmmeMemoRadiSam system protein A [Neptunomonas japonica]